MEAPRGVERTGTNGRTHERPSPGSGRPPWSPCRRQSPRVTGDRRTKRGKSPLASLSGPRTTGTTPRPRRRGHKRNKSCGGHGPGETPSPIPNLEAKARHGDGTAPGRVWESSTPPHQHLHGGPGDRQHANPQDPLHIPTNKQATAYLGSARRRTPLEHVPNVVSSDVVIGE